MGAFGSTLDYKRQFSVFVLAPLPTRQLSAFVIKSHYFRNEVVGFFVCVLSDSGKKGKKLVPYLSTSHTPTTA